MWEMDDDQVKAKICDFAKRPAAVLWSGRAERDIANTRGVTKQGIFDGIIEHLSCGYAVQADYMDNGDVAYIFHCYVGPGRLYVKLKFVFIESEERMNIFSAHLNR